MVDPVARTAREHDQTRLLGPADHGLALALEAFEAAEFELGWRYDLVDGRLEVGPEANLPHDRAAMALSDLFAEYGAQHPDAFSHRSLRSPVFPRGGRSSIGPDLALFQGLRPEAEDQHWRDLQPQVVVEVISPGQARKDLVRNRRCYAEVPSIREYWVLDPRRGRELTTLLALSRASESEPWTERLIPPGGRHESQVFPGLVVDLSRADLGLDLLVQARLERLRQEGARALLERQLAARFGALPREIAARLAMASSEALARWAERVLVATNLQELFGDDLS